MAFDVMLRYEASGLCTGFFTPFGMTARITLPATDPNTHTSSHPNTHTSSHPHILGPVQTDCAGPSCFDFHEHDRQPVGRVFRS